MPFVVDDVLVDFDDDRSLEALKLLSSLSGKIQIILFTHHSRIVELSKSPGITAKIHYLT